MNHYLLGLLGTGLIVLGANRGGWGWLFVWLGGNFLALYVAHRRANNHAFGKRADGSLPLWSWVLFLPLHVYTLAVWHLLRLVGREAAFSVVTDQLVVGRRTLAHEVDESFDNWVDLTAEFAEPVALRTRPGYQSFPILDAAAPSVDELRAAVDRLVPGKTFIHCAQGHGRTGLFAVAVLLKSGAATTVADGLHRLQSVRPGIRLNRRQLNCIRQFAEDVYPQPRDRPIAGWIPSTPEVRGDTFAETVRRHPAIAVDFWAAWNGIDQSMDRTIQEIAPGFAGRLAFYSCNADLEENVALCRRCNWANLPALWIIVGNRPQKPIIGLLPPDKLADRVESILRAAGIASAPHSE